MSFTLTIFLTFYWPDPNCTDCSYLYRLILTLPAPIVMNRTAPNLKEGGFSEYGDMLCGVGSEPWPTKLHNNFFTGLVLLRTLWPILTLGCVYMVNSDKRSAFEWCLDLREQQIECSSKTERSYADTIAHITLSQ